MSDDKFPDQPEFANRELSPPANVTQDPVAVEFLRAWVVNNKLELSFDPVAFGNAETWGHMIAGIVRQVADARGAARRGTAERNYAEIRKTLLADLERLEEKRPTVAKA